VAEFRGEIYGCRGPASRLGSKASGITVRANTWRVQVEVEMHLQRAGEKDERRTVSVIARPYNGSGALITLFEGTEAQLIAKIERAGRAATRRFAAQRGI